MKRASCLVLCTAILAGGACFAQGAVRQEMVPAPVRSASAPAVPAHPSPYNFPGVQYPRIEDDSRVTFQFKAPAAQKVQDGAVVLEDGLSGLHPNGGAGRELPVVHLRYDLLDGVLDHAPGACVRQY